MTSPKNNMSVINALLDLQASYIGDKRLEQAFAVTQDRIRSMALVHQKLYEANDLSRINLKDYINDLMKSLLDSHFIPSRQISFVAEMEDVFVLIDTAIPCGLILNELISNALKYAFSGKSTGEISIHLCRMEDGVIYFNVSDNGIGLPAGFDINRDGRMGMQTILALAESQLKAHISFLSEGGVSCKLQFKDNLYQSRI